MERNCQNCPYYYVNGFEDWPKCNRYTDNDGKCWAEEEDEGSEE